MADKTWLPVADGYETLNVEVQRNTEISHLNVYKTLAKLRTEPAFRHGRYESVAYNSDIFAFKRYVNIKLIQYKSIIFFNSSQSINYYIININYIINQLNKSDFINQVGQILAKLRFFDEFRDIENVKNIFQYFDISVASNKMEISQFLIFNNYFWKMRFMHILF